MSSVWVNNLENKLPVKVEGMLKPWAARRNMRKLAGEYIVNRAKMGIATEATIFCNDEIWFYENGKYAGSCWCEHISPPSKSDGRDGRRALQPA